MPCLKCEADSVCLYYHLYVSTCLSEKKHTYGRKVFGSFKQWKFSNKNAWSRSSRRNILVRCRNFFSCCFERHFIYLHFSVVLYSPMNIVCTNIFLSKSIFSSSSYINIPRTYLNISKDKWVKSCVRDTWFVSFILRCIDLMMYVHIFCVLMPF